MKGGLDADYCISRCYAEFEYTHVTLLGRVGSAQPHNIPVNMNTITEYNSGPFSFVAIFISRRKGVHAGL